MLSLIVIVAAVWLVVFPLTVMGLATLKAELEDRRRVRELDRWLTTVLSGGRSRSRLARRVRRHKKASRAVGPAGTLTQRSSTSYERL